MSKKPLNEISLNRLINYIGAAGRFKHAEHGKRIEKRNQDPDRHDENSPEMKDSDRRLRNRDKGLYRASIAIHKKTGNHIEEDAPTVSAGAGGVAGIGVGPQGEPGVSTKAQRKHNKNKSTPTPVILGMLRRKAPNPIAEAINKGGTLTGARTAHTTKKERMDAHDKKPKHIRNLEKGAFASVSIPSNIHPHKAKSELERIRRKSSEATYGKGYPSDIPPVRSEERESFAGAVVFEVNSKLFHNLTLAKRKGKHWRTYLEEDDCYAEIREWARKNKGPIVVRNECTGEMRYVRYGR